MDSEIFVSGLKIVPFYLNPIVGKMLGATIESYYPFVIAGILALIMILALGIVAIVSSLGHYVQNMLGENEEIMLICRTHWWVLFKDILIELIIMFVLFGVLIAFGIGLIPTNFITEEYYPWAMIAIGIVFAIPFVSLIRSFLIWWNLQFIVTNRRIIQISGIFNKNVADSSLEKVNDIKMEQSVIGRLFNYGHIEILTASEKGINLFRFIQNPLEFKKTLLDAKEHLHSDSDYIMAPINNRKVVDIPASIEALDKLRQNGVITEEEFSRKKRELLQKMK